MNLGLCNKLTAVQEGSRLLGVIQYSIVFNFKLQRERYLVNLNLYGFPHTTTQ